MALPIPPILGSVLDRGSTTPNLVPQLPAVQAAQPPIFVRRFARNGRLPDAWAASAMGEAMNQAAMYRTKQVFSALNVTNDSSVGIYPAPGASAVRWRWAFHTGPMTHLLHVVAIMHPSAVGATDAYSTVTIQKMSGGGTVSDDFHVGANPVGSTGFVGWQYLRVFHSFLAVDPDTDYEGFVTDGTNALMQSCCVFEVASMTTNYGGYFPQNVVERAPILSTDRQRMMQLIRDLWRRGGSHVLNWYCQQSGVTPRSITATTPTNLVDGTSTTPSSSTPGYTLDMTYKDRLTETSGVPCKMYVYAKRSVGAAACTVYLKNSAGTTIASVTGFTGTAGWISTQFNLPATLDKYDVQAAVATAGTTVQIHAVSIFEYTP